VKKKEKTVMTKEERKVKQRGKCGCRSRLAEVPPNRAEKRQNGRKAAHLNLPKRFEETSKDQTGTESDGTSQMSARSPWRRINAKDVRRETKNEKGSESKTQERPTSKEKGRVRDTEFPSYGKKTTDDECKNEGNWLSASGKKTGNEAGKRLKGGSGRTSSRERTCTNIEEGIKS